jgi:PAS domain S-box-containing protein
VSNTVTPQAGNRARGPSDGGPDVDHRIKLLCRVCFDGIFIVDDDRRLIGVSRMGAKLLGAPRKELAGRRLDDFTPSTQQVALKRIWDEFQRSGEHHGTWEVQRADGSRIPIEYRAATDYGQGEHLVAARSLAARDGSDLPDRSPGWCLTAREREVLQLAAYGNSTREIAELLFLSPGTVKTHFQRAYAKLGTHDRSAAVAECMRREIIR